MESTLAAMANTADYSAMNYGELLATKNAFNWALGMSIDPLLSTKRLEEMSEITHKYITAMNLYCATKSEILSCLDKEDLRINPLFSSDDVDEQDAHVTTPAEQKEDQASEDCLLASYEAPISIQGDIDVIAHMKSLLASASKSEEDNQTNSMASSSEEETLARSAKIEEDTIDENIPKTVDQANMMAVEWAIEKAKGCKIPEEINTGASYRTEYTFGYDVLNGPILRKSNGRNMMSKKLADLKNVERKHVEYYRGGTNIISTDDCLAYMASNDEIVVVLYHVAEEASGGEENTNSDTIGNHFSDEEQIVMKNKIAAVKKAMKSAIEQSAKNEAEANTYYYDRYTYGKKKIQLKRTSRHFVNDIDTLVDMKANLEAYAKLVYDDPVIVSTDNSLAVMPGDNIIFVAVYNIPVRKKVTAKRKKAGKAETVVETKAVNSFPISVNENPTIKKAVEMTVSLPAPKGIDTKSPYFVQQNLDIINDDDIVYNGKTFGDNVNASSFENVRKRHQKYANVINASHISSTNDYTAYVSHDGKSVSVYLYHPCEGKVNN